jgi:hypothetical protein
VERWKGSGGWNKIKARLGRGGSWGREARSNRTQGSENPSHPFIPPSTPPPHLEEPHVPRLHRRPHVGVLVKAVALQEGRLGELAQQHLALGFFGGGGARVRKAGASREREGGAV